MNLTSLFHSFKGEPRIPLTNRLHFFSRITLDVNNVAYYFSIMTHDAVGFDSVFQRLCKTGDPVADGAAFEELCCWFLQNAAAWKDDFDAVWRWRELKWGRDIGIDIVARRRSPTRRA